LTAQEWIERFRKLRSLQRSFFATRNPKILEELRPLEESTLKLLIENAESHTPEVWDAKEVCKSMLINQSRWIKAKAYQKEVHALISSATDEQKKGADQRVVLLEGTCKKLERRLDKILEDIERPRLPGLGDP